MISNSRRLKTQIYFEELLGCGSPERLKDFQDQATSIELNSKRARIFREQCDLDCESFLFKGALSLVAGLASLAHGQQTWPVVQMYYATYYLLRADLFLKKRCILRANRVFTILCRNGQSVKKVSNRNAKSDHQLTIFFAKRYLSSGDILLSQTIDEIEPYQWLMQRRDWYQYKQGNYIETDDRGPFFDFDIIGLEDQINMFLSDNDPYFCFDPDYAALALPIKKLQLTAAEALSEGISLSSQKISVLRGAAGAFPAIQRVVELLK